MRHRARVDDNQPAVVDALRKAGWSVACTHTVGSGFPDLVIGKHGLNLLIEIKDEAKKPSQRRLTPDEQRWHDGWRGNVLIVTSARQAVECAENELIKEA